MPRPNPRKIDIRVVKHGTAIKVPSLSGDGTYVDDAHHPDGLYFTPLGAPNGFFVAAPDLWAALDKLLE